MSETSSDTFDVPLYLVDADGIYKIGIEVSLDGGQTYQMYEFDTGGKGFWIADDAAWGTTVSTGITASNTYSSGLEYNGTLVSTAITLENSTGGTVSTDGTVVQISTVTNTNTSTNSDVEWNTTNASDGGPPLYSNFYGDFGVSLADKDGLESLLKEFGTSLSEGYIITLNSLSSIGTIADGGTYAIGTLQLGLTDQQIADYAASGTIAMAGSTTNSYDNYVYSEQIVNGTIATNGTTGSETGIVLDTGAPNTFIPAGTSITYDAPVNSLTLTADSSTGTATILDYVLGNDQSENTLSGGADAGTGAYVNSGLDAFLGKSIMFNVDNAGGGYIAIEAACFAEGTHLATPAGPVAVENLIPGMTVMTLRGTARPIRWVGHRTVECARHAEPSRVHPVRISAHAFGPGLPARALFLSPDHAVFGEGVLVPVKQLINGDSIRQVAVDAVRYFHIELESHDVVLAEGLPVETYLDTGDRGAFSNGAGALALHPAWGSAARDVTLIMDALGAAPFKVAGVEVERLRARVNAAAGQAHRAA